MDNITKKQLHQQLNLNYFTFRRSNRTSFQPHLKVSVAQTQPQSRVPLFLQLRSHLPQDPGLISATERHKGIIPHLLYRSTSPLDPSPPPVPLPTKPPLHPSSQAEEEDYRRPASKAISNGCRQQKTNASSCGYIANVLLVSLTQLLYGCQEVEFLIVSDTLLLLQVDHLHFLCALCPI